MRQPHIMIRVQLQGEKLKKGRLSEKLKITDLILLISVSILTVHTQNQYSIEKKLMKIMSYPLCKNLGIANNPKKRPKTAQSSSYTQVLDILEGKYTSINQNYRLTHNHTDNRFPKPTPLLLQMSKSLRKSNKNSCLKTRKLQDCSALQQRHDSKGQCKQNQKKINKQPKNKPKSNNFIRYADQEIRYLKSEGVLMEEMPKTEKSERFIKRTRTHTKKSIQNEMLEDKESLGNSLLSSWKNEDQLGFSTILNTNWVE